MQNVIIMCRQECTSRVAEAVARDRVASAKSLAHDVNLVAEQIVKKGYRAVCVHATAVKWDVITIEYTKYLSPDVTSVEIGRLNELLEDCVGVVIVGVPAMAGTEKAFSAGTYNYVAWHDYSVNGVKTGEIGIYQRFFETKGIPVLAVCSDEAACKEAEAFAENAEMIPVKSAKYRSRAVLYEEKTVDEAISKGVEKGLQRAGKVPPKGFDKYVITVLYNRTDFCDDAYARNNGWLKRLDGRTLEKTFEKPKSFFDFIF